MPVTVDQLFKNRHELINPTLKTAVVNAVAALFPIETQDKSIVIRCGNVKIDDSKFKADAHNDHQDARERGETRFGDIVGDLEVVEGTKVTHKAAGFKLGRLPLMGVLGTFMVKGSDYYTPMAQLRLKPGAYTREKANGEYECFIPMKNAQMSVWMDPSNGVFKLGFYSANVNWYSIVNALGAENSEIKAAFGGDQRAVELLGVNEREGDKKEADVKKLFLAVFDRVKHNRDLLRAGIDKKDDTLASTPYAEQIAKLKEWMEGQEVDPYVTNKTLGKAISTMGKTLLLEAAKNILLVSRNERKPDDRDSLEFKGAYGIDDLMAEKIKKTRYELTSKILRRLKGGDSSISHMFGRNWLDPVTIGYFGGTEDVDAGLTSTAEAANPLAILSEQSKLTITGPGGISSDHAIADSARLFRPNSTNFIDPTHTVEGSKIGITTHTAVNVVKDGHKLRAPFFAVKNGKLDKSKLVFLSVEEATDAAVSYPEFYDKDGSPKNSTVRVNKDGGVFEVPAAEAQYCIPTGPSAFDHASNAALFFAHTHPNRGLMSAKHISQGLPLVHRERPLMGFTSITGQDALSQIANSFVVRSSVAGKVFNVTPKSINVDGTEHQLFDQYPMQAKVALHHIPVVKIGDVVKKGDLLADTNYTKDGALALGTNLRSAYMPAKNASNFEDSVVISESAAKKLTSEHMHRYDLSLEPGMIVDKQLAMAQFPSHYTTDNSKVIGASGVVKVGTIVKPGDPLICAVRKATFNENDTSGVNLSRIHKLLTKPYKDISVYYEEIYPGTVYRIVRTGEKIEVQIKTEEPMAVGDKISMSSAAKGTVSQINPDDKMPRNKAGEHMEILFNPHGVAGRFNPSQTVEQSLGKLIKAGGSYSFANFDGVNHAEEANKKLKELGIEHAEALFDPEDNKWLEKPVATGYNYVYKLDHPIRKKFSARTRNSYTLDETPTQGGGVGGQSTDQLTGYALLGHNAHALLSESVGVKGAKNDDYWQAYQAGLPTPAPKVPLAFTKLENMLNAAGIDTNIKGDEMNFLPLTEKRVRERSNGEVSRAALLKTRAAKAKDFAEEEGGIFDKDITGGLFGDKWSHIELTESIPHPLYEKVLRDITGLKTSEYYGLIAGTKYYNPTTKEFTDVAGKGLLTGEAAFKAVLAFDASSKMRDLKVKLQTAVGSDRNKYHRALRYLRGLKEMGLTPTEAYMTKAIPVIPPKFRPITELAGGSLRVSDSNLLYRDILLSNEQVTKAKAENLPDEHLADARTATYKAFGALVGINNPLTHRDDREDAKGFIDVIRGKQNKQGYFQKVIARRRNDYTGRSTVEPDAGLGVDEIGLPEDMAWQVYQPAIVRRMAMSGWNPADAMKEVEKRTVAARGALDAEMATRPVIYNRSPSLHRWSIAAAMPRIAVGKEIRVSPAAIGPQGMDFDGDTVAIHVGLSEDARKESFNLLPSKNLYYDRDRSLAYTLDKDIVTGIFALTRPGTTTGLKFESEEEAINAYRNNKNNLKMSSLVVIKGNSNPQSVGWLIFKTLVPPRFLGALTPPIDGKKLKGLLEQIAEKSPADYNAISRKLMQAGFSAGSSAGGITATIGELAIDRVKIDKLLNQMQSDINKGKTYKEKQEFALKAKSVYEPQLQELIKSHLKNEDAGYNMFLEAKPSGKINIGGFTQMLASPILMTDVHDNVVPLVLKSSYGSGMGLSDYILTTPGARKGMVAKSLATALPGSLAKEVAANLTDVRIYEHDCGTTKGIEVELSPVNAIKGHDTDILDRVAIESVGGVVNKNDVITVAVLSKLRDKGIKHLKVRSPMTCIAQKPPCQLCAGADPTGKLWPIGSNIGYNYGQGISERSTQLTLRLFHSGGAIGTGDSLMSGFNRFRELLSAPETVKNQGVLADVDGTVTNIRLAPQGGWYVTLNNTHQHHVQQGRALLVKDGEKVKLGQAISDGSYKPQEIAAKKGLLAAQQYVVDQGRKAYLDAGEVIRKPVLEVLAAGMMRNVEIVDDGGEKDLACGDVLHENDYEKRKLKNPRIKAVPAILGISAKPLESKDLFERLNFQRLEGSLSEVPASAGKSNLRGSYSPIAGIAYGAKFRENEIKMTPNFMKEAEAHDRTDV